MIRIVFLTFFLFSGSVFAQKYSVQFKKGLRLIRESRFNEAIKVLEDSIQIQEISDQAATYYLIGIANFETEKYDSALNSFETALDLSVDPKLDAQIDERIDKTIQRQNFIEAGRFKNKFSYFLGIGYDSNVLNLNKDTFTGVDITAFSALYGLTYARTLVRNFDYQVVPEISVSDNYSLNSTFAATSTVQSVDALQLSLLVPVQISTDWFSDYDTITPQVGFKSLYLPTDSEKRSLSFASMYFTLKSVFNITNYYIFMPQATYSIDTSSLTYVDPDDNQSAKRMNVEFDNTILLSKNQYKINLNMLFEENIADGINSSYTKMGAVTEFRLSTVPNYDIGFQLKYYTTDYTKRVTIRNDQLTSVGLDVIKSFNKDQSLALNLSGSSKTSNNTLNAYQDIAVSVVFAEAYTF